MPTYDEVMNALRKADAAGATEDAQRLAQIARSLKQAEPAEQPKESTTLMQDIGEGAINLGKGALSGAASIPNSLNKAIRFLNPFDKVANKTGSELAMEDFDKQNADSTAFKVGKIGAQVAGTMGVGGALGNTVKGISQSPQALAIAEALRTGGIGTQAADLPARMAAGSVVGGTSDLMTGGDGSVGSIVGGLLPGGVQVAKAIGNGIRGTTNLFLPGGAERIAKHFENKIVGENARQKVIDALKQAQEIVPGSKPTAAEALAGLPEGSPIMAQQKITAQSPGGISAEFGQRALDQQAARQAALEPVAQTKQILSDAIAKRSVNAEKAYQTAFNNATKADPKLLDLAQNPYFKDALPDAFKLAQAKGITPKDDLTQFLHYVKLSLDKQIGKTGDTALSNTERGAVNDVKQQLINWVGSKNPDYEAARAAFSAESKPINQMEVGQYLKDKLLNPLNESERAIAYAQALRDAPKTIKNSTGFNKFDDLSQVLTPDQVKSVTSVGEDLARKNASVNPLQSTALQGAVNIADNARSHIPQMLSRPAMVANAIMKYAGHGIEPKVDKVMAQHFLNPEQLAKNLEKLPPSKRGEIIKLLATKTATLAGQQDSK